MTGQIEGEGDVLILRGKERSPFFRLFASGSATHMQGDADDDADVDGVDFLTWQRQLGSASTSASATAAVPEPSCLMAGLIGLALAAMRRRVRR